MFKHIVILTGAGISAESGIPVFRSETGLWEQERVEDVATYEGFLRNKTKVHDFYNKMRQSIKSKEPNPAHLALTCTRKQELKMLFICTVNLTVSYVKNVAVAIAILKIPQ